MAVKHKYMKKYMNIKHDICPHRAAFIFPRALTLSHEPK